MCDRAFFSSGLPQQALIYVPMTTPGATLASIWIDEGNLMGKSFVLSQVPTCEIHSHLTLQHIFSTYPGYREVLIASIVLNDEE